MERASTRCDVVTTTCVAGPARGTHQSEWAANPAMNGPVVDGIAAAIATATFAYLTVRIVGVVSGPGRLHPRLMTALEVRRPRPRSLAPLRSIDLWLLVGLLIVIEGTLGKQLLDAMAQANWAGTLLIGAHFALSAAWLVYLRSAYDG